MPATGSTPRRVRSSPRRTTGPALHPWVEAFNAGHPADQWFGRDWTKLRPDLDYEKQSGPDDAAGEGQGIAQGRTFPHLMTGGLKEPGPKYYDAVVTSPYANELLLNLVKRAIDADAWARTARPTSSL